MNGLNLRVLITQCIIIFKMLAIVGKPMYHLFKQVTYV